MAYSGVLFHVDGFEDETIAAANIQFGVSLRLPFRVRVAGLFRIPMVDDSAAVWMYNELSIPDQDALLAALHATSSSPGGRERLWTRVLVVLREPALTPEAVAEVGEGVTKSLGLNGNLFSALSVLNEVTYGYSQSAASMFGGRALRFLTDTEFFDGLELEFGIVGPDGYELVESDAKEVFDWQPSVKYRTEGQLTGHLEDLSAEVLDAIPSYIGQLRQHAFHELAFKAKMAMIDREPLVALVLACAALEGAHAAFVGVTLGHKLSQHPKGEEGILQNLLREQGIHTLIEVTVYAWMAPSQRPTEDELAACRDALTVRNAIVHAKKKKGTYKMRQQSFMDLSKAYSAVLKVFDKFVDALPA